MDNKRLTMGLEAVGILCHVTPAVPLYSFKLLRAGLMKFEVTVKDYNIYVKLHLSANVLFSTAPCDYSEIVTYRFF